MNRVTLQDISLKDYGLSERVSRLREIYFRAMPEICVERPRLLTRFSLEQGLFNRQRVTALDKARLYRQILEKRRPMVRHTTARENSGRSFAFTDGQLFAGSTTGKFKGVPLYPEFLALTIWPELQTISNRAANPLYLSEAEANELNRDIFPHWLKHNILELARDRSFAENFRRHGLDQQAPEIKLMERLVFFLASKPSCISHTIPDFSRALGLGLRGLIEEANERRRACGNEEKKEFYAAIGEVLTGIISYSRNLALEAERLANEEKEPGRKKELLEMAAIHRQVPEFPATTFREGLSTVWICWTAIHLENPNIGLSLGRLDQILYNLYRQEMASGALSIQDAIELLCLLWLKIGDHVPMVPEAGEQLFGGSGSNQAITMGGVDSNGKDAVNDLTYVMLRATELMRLRDPNPNMRYLSGINSSAYLHRLCEVNINTGAIPAIHNDKAVIKALIAKGESLEQARDYGVIGCVEPGSNGRSYGHTGAILLNLASVLELTLFNGRHRHTGMDLLISRETGSPSSFTSFAELKAAFATQVRWIVEQTTVANNLFGEIHRDFHPTPILSALFEGPMESGKDLSEGGAVLNSSGVAIIGLADVADSLCAIRRMVFDEQRISLVGLIDAARKNFQVQADLQLRLMNPEKTPKYGNEDPEADEMVAWLVELLDREYGNRENYRGGRYRVGYWTMTNHAGFGRLMGAIPSGRKALENFSSGITPVSGVTPFLSKALGSVASLPARCLANGAALNIKYTPEHGNREKMIANFAASVEGCFDDQDGRDGPLEIQFNVTTRDTLADAVANPEKHRELLVRVSGYTAYFKDFTPQMQKEIIDRSEFLLSSGRMVPCTPFPLPARRT